MHELEPADRPASGVDAVLKRAVNLTNCDREPIHIPGSIQAHGVLLGLDQDLCIRVASSNTSELFGYEAQALLGSPLRTLLDDASERLVREARGIEPLRQLNPLKLAIRPALGKTEAALMFDGILHRSDELLLLELEPIDPSDVSFKGFYAAVQKAIARIQATKGIGDLCTVVAAEVRTLTGFDRVMVYRFDTDWHGEVIAEAKRGDLEPFLGLHYPASDIPLQARVLYEKNWLRLIYDVNYQPSRLVPEGNPLTNGPLDLSHAVLRSVSPIHCEYLRNMGVAASMSVSLVHDGAKLWGLIACHHYSRRLVPYEVRLASEFLGQTLSLLLSSRESLAVSQQQTHVEQVKTDLIDRASTAEHFAEALLAKPDDFLSLTRAGGGALLLDGKLSQIGHTPTPAQTMALAQWLDRLDRRKSFATESLTAQYAQGLAFAPVASGVLSIALGGTATNDRIFWFRQELVHTVDWAGVPGKEEVGDNGEVRLSPRGSFALWKETVRLHALRWQPVDVAAAEGLAHAINRVVLAKAHEIKQLNEDLRAAARAKDEFLAVVSHELRTPLNAILGWIELLENDDLAPEEYDEAFATIRRNATAQQQLIEDLLDVSRIVSGKMRLTVEDADPHSFVSAAIDAARPAAEAKGIRLQTILDPSAGTISGDPTRLQQIVWNLLSNAVKFTPKGGRVFVRLKREQSSIHITVADNGEGIAPDFLPYVFDRFKQADAHANRRHQGLGLGLAIVRHLAELHGGTISVDSEGLGKGSSFLVALPIAPVVNRDAPRREARQGPSKIECPSELIGLRILVVDDAPDARRMMERILMKCKAVVYTADGALSGLEALKRERPDILISDIGMPEIDGYAFIKMVRGLSEAEGGRLPAVALTAFARAEDRTQALLAGFSTHIAKPIAQRELLAVVAGISGRNMPAKSP